MSWFCRSWLEMFAPNITLFVCVFRHDKKQTNCIIKIGSDNISKKGPIHDLNGSTITWIEKQHPSYKSVAALLFLLRRRRWSWWRLLWWRPPDKILSPHYCCCNFIVCSDLLLLLWFFVSWKIIWFTRNCSIFIL